MSGALLELLCSLCVLADLFFLIFQYHQLCIDELFGKQMSLCFLFWVIFGNLEIQLFQLIVHLLFVLKLDETVEGLWVHSCLCIVLHFLFLCFCLVFSVFLIFLF